jgi:hypothetical protein
MQKLTRKFWSRGVTMATALLVYGCIPIFATVLILQRRDPND